MLDRLVTEGQTDGCLVRKQLYSVSFKECVCDSGGQGAEWVLRPFLRNYLVESESLPYATSTVSLNCWRKMAPRMD